MNSTHIFLIKALFIRCTSIQYIAINCIFNDKNDKLFK